MSCTAPHYDGQRLRIAASRANIPGLQALHGARPPVVRMTSAPGQRSSKSMQHAEPTTTRRALVGDCSLMTSMSPRSASQTRNCPRIGAGRINDPVVTPQTPRGLPGPSPPCEDLRSRRQDGNVIFIPSGRKSQQLFSSNCSRRELSPPNGVCTTLKPVVSIPLLAKVRSIRNLFEASALREEERCSGFETKLTNSVSQEPIRTTPKEDPVPSEAEQGTKDRIAYAAEQGQSFQDVERAELINEIKYLQSVVEKESKKSIEHAELVNEVERLKRVIEEERQRRWEETPRPSEEEEEEDEEEEEEHRAKVENFWKAFYERKFNKWKAVHDQELEEGLSNEMIRLEGAVEEVNKRSSEEMMSQKIAHCRAIQEMEESVSKALQENRRLSLLVEQLRDERSEIGAVTEIAVGKLESKDLDSSMHRQPSMSTASIGSDSDDFECLRQVSGSSLSSSPYSSWQGGEADSSTGELVSPRRKMLDKLAEACGWATPEVLSPRSPRRRAQSYPAQRAVTDYVRTI